MKLHSRHQLVERARIELMELIDEWIKKHRLTAVEAMRCITGETHELTRYMLRRERHPDDPDKKADEE
jgi:hypothetical protein